ncbi:cytochrome P450 [Streptomyces sp. NPDC050560]|uniref:cytochrome P450 n=1 Tax=Streptomyces sp. NPDC050560 TaxID=3365630 RepID=UPI00379C45BB
MAVTGQNTAHGAAGVSTAALAADPHPRLAALRASSLVTWVPAVGGWMVTGYESAVAVMRDPAGFTVDDPRFTTARVIGPSMLSLDGAAHAAHRDPFTGPFRPRAVHGSFAGLVERESALLLDALAPDGGAELRRGFAGPLAAVVMAEALGLRDVPVADILGWYDAIVRAVDTLTRGGDPGDAGGAAYGALRAAVAGTLDAGRDDSLLVRAAAGGALDTTAVASNAAVLLFGGIETTEGMIANALLHILTTPGTAELLAAEPGLLDGVIEESLRMEPGAAVVDRYAARDTELAGGGIAAGDLVVVSLAGANRDPAVFPDPDRFDPRRANARSHLTFAHGPHYCLGAHLARLETRVALRACLERLPSLRLADPEASAPYGLVFRKPARLDARWDV